MPPSYDGLRGYKEQAMSYMTINKPHPVAAFTHRASNTLLLQHYVCILARISPMAAARHTTDPQHTACLELVVDCQRTSMAFVKKCIYLHCSM